ncbi:MAG TPA: hypothetical protein VGL45_16770 [Bradyrhizobium sp.]|jgi:hypothetical protein
MEFESASPSVVRYIKQRELLNAWLRVRAVPPRLMPRLSDYRPERFTGEMADMMGFDVIRSDAGVRFLITQEGARLTATYGNEDPAKRPSRFLDDSIGPDRYARVLQPYLVCLERKRPTYSVSTVQDADGKDVSYERLLLPFGQADAVEQIVGSYKAISIEGGFKVDNLMGIRPKAVPVSVINAVIDADFVRPAPAVMSDDLIELD